MTFEQKVEKLREIVDTDVKIWCKTAEEDNEFAEFANLLIKKENEKYILNCDLDKTMYKVVSEEDGKGLAIIYLDYNCDKEGCVPYSEFFADDKVKVDKPLGEWTLSEVKEYDVNNCDNFEDCE